MARSISFLFEFVCDSGIKLSIGLTGLVRFEGEETTLSGFKQFLNGTTDDFPSKWKLSPNKQTNKSINEKEKNTEVKYCDDIHE